MLRSLRYQNPKVRDHLASQYAMGLLLPLVKRRVEKLMQQDSAFEQEVRAWQERLSPMNDLVEPKPAPAFVKQNVMRQIQLSPDTPASKLGAWWQSLWVWQGVALVSMALFVIVLLGPFSTTSELPARLAYVAVMQTAEGVGESPLVISAYGKTDTKPSRLELRWNDRSDKLKVDQTTLWAIERDTGKVTQLTTLASGTQSVNLTADQWQAVKNSLELIVVQGTDFSGDIVMRGPCIQLADWDRA